MRFLPVVARELGAIARRPSAYWIRSGAALAAFLAMGWVALLGLRIPLFEQGRSLFQLLSFGGFVYCLVAGIRGTSDALSEEKREGTLGLLFLTDLKGHDVVFGKFVSLSINSVYGILAIVPALALAFLLGGTSPSQFVLMSLCLLNTLFFSLAAGILVSTFCQNERAAMSGTLGIIFAIAAAPYLIAVWHTFGILDIWEVLLPGFLLTSPVFAFRAAGDANLARFLQDEILLSIAFLHLAGWLCLVIASACISRRAHADAPRGRFLAWFMQLRNYLAYGKAKHRYAIRARLLDRNAFFWLASRDRLKRRYAWTFLILFAGLWALARWATPDLLSDWPVTLGSLWFLHLFFKIWIASEVAARFIEDRRSNALELLLTTPLAVTEFIRGQLLALIRQFAGPLSLILFLNIVAAFSARGSFGYAFQSGDAWQYFVIGVIHLIADFFVILWVAIWRSQHLRGTNRTILQTAFFVAVIPAVGLFLLFWTQWVLSIAFNIAEPPALTTYWRWTIGCLAYDALLVSIARNAFFRDFRDIATQNFDRPTKTKIKPTKLEVARKRSKKRALRLAFAGCGVICCLLIAAAFRRHRLRGEVQQRFAQIRAQGLPLTQIEAASYLPIPRDREALGALMRDAQRVFVPLRSSDLLRRGIQRRDPEARLQALTYLQNNEAVLKLLEDLPNRKSIRRTGNDGRGRFSRVNPEVFIELLELKTMLEMERGDPASAHSLSLLLHLGRALEGGAFAGQGLNRQSLIAAQHLLESAAASRAFNAAQWREYQKTLNQIDPINDLRAALVLERVNGLELLGSSPDFLWQNFGRGSTSFPALFTASLAFRRFVGQDQKEILEYVDVMQAGIDQCREPLSLTIRTMPKRGRRGPGLVSSSMIAPQITPATGWLLKMATAQLARLRVLQAAIAVEIFRAEHNRLPETLSETGFALHDPFTDREIRYSKIQDGYSASSAGEDSRDFMGRRGAERHITELIFRCESVKDP